MLFGSVLKEIQAPRGIPTLDGEHSHKAGNIHMGREHSHRAGIPKNLAGNNYIFHKTTNTPDVTTPIILRYTADVRSGSVRSPRCSMSDGVLWALTE